MSSTARSPSNSADRPTGQNVSDRSARFGIAAPHNRHCERSEAIQGDLRHAGLVRFARNDESPVIRNLFHRKNYLRSEEPTSELQSLMRISYAVFCMKNNK